MKDIFGQEIEVGNKVVWIGGKTQYSGVQVYEVIKLTAKMVRIRLQRKESTPFLQTREPVVRPDDVVVVDKLM